MARVDWYLKVDLKNGYRQLPVHLTDWHAQVYSLGPNEFYIDITMPFGKANSSRYDNLRSGIPCGSGPRKNHPYKQTEKLRTRNDFENDI